MIPESLRKQLESSLNKFLSDTCSVLKKSIIRDEYGQELEQWEEKHSNVPCRLIYSSTNSQSQASIISEQETLIQSSRIILNKDYGVSVNDKIKIGDDEYSVISIDDNLTNRLYIDLEVIKENNG